MICANCHRNKLPGKPHMCEAAGAPMTCTNCGDPNCVVPNVPAPAAIVLLKCERAAHARTRAQLDAENERAAWADVYRLKVGDKDVSVSRCGRGGGWVVMWRENYGAMVWTLDAAGNWCGYGTPMIEFPTADAAFAALDNARKERS